MGLASETFLLLDKLQLLAAAAAAVAIAAEKQDWLGSSAGKRREGARERERELVCGNVYSK